MISLSQIETDLVGAMKAKDQVRVDTLRALKTRIVNEQVAKAKSSLDEKEITALVRSEVKRRREAAEGFVSGGRQESADKELAEAKILEAYLPVQLSEEQVAAAVDQALGGASYTAADFGKVMGQLKAALGDTADGSMVARLLKEKLK